MKKAIVIILVFVVLFSGCEEKKEWRIADESYKLLVVDAMITNEKKIHEVKLSWSVTNPTKIPAPVTNANIAIGEYRYTREDLDTAFFLAHDEQIPGLYKTQYEFRAVFGRNYLLVISINGAEFEAIASMLPVSPFQEYSFTPVGENHYSYNYFEDLSPSVTEVYFDWSHLPEFSNVPDSLCRAKQFFYTLSSVDVPQFFGPDKESVVFPKGTKVKRTKYSLSTDHELFIRSMMLETDWKGGHFDVLPGNVWSNLSIGATGFFAVTTILKDSTTAW